MPNNFENIFIQFEWQEFFYVANFLQISTKDLIMLVSFP